MVFVMETRYVFFEVATEFLNSISINVTDLLYLS
jgi:hypothetical protein